MICIKAIGKNLKGVVEMAVNRYYMRCPVCGELLYIGKSCAEGIYTVADVTKGIHEWMWEHLLGCHKDEAKQDLLFEIHGEGIVVK